MTLTELKEKYIDGHDVDRINIQYENELLEPCHKTFYINEFFKEDDGRNYKELEDATFDYTTEDYERGEGDGIVTKKYLVISLKKPEESIERYKKALLLCKEKKKEIEKKEGVAQLGIVTARWFMSAYPTCIPKYMVNDEIRKLNILPKTTSYFTICEPSIYTDAIMETLITESYKDFQKGRSKVPFEDRIKMYEDFTALSDYMCDIIHDKIDDDTIAEVYGEKSDDPDDVCIPDPIDIFEDYVESFMREATVIGLSESDKKHMSPCTRPIAHSKSYVEIKNMFEEYKEMYPRAALYEVSLNLREEDPHAVRTLLEEYDLRIGTEALEKFEKNLIVRGATSTKEEK